METYDKAIELISIIKETRILINRANNRLSNIEEERKNITQGSLLTEKYAKEYAEMNGLLEESFQKYEESYEILMSLEEKIDSNKWKVILKKLGVVLGETENINHVKDAIDEYTLDIAVKETMETYKYKKLELARAYKNENQNKIIILESELKTLEKDLSKHLLGTLTLANYESLCKK